MFGDDHYQRNLISRVHEVRHGPWTWASNHIGDQRLVCGEELDHSGLETLNADIILRVKSSSKDCEVPKGASVSHLNVPRGALASWMIPQQT
jgi:hypothetical protein